MKRTFFLLATLALAGSAQTQGLEELVAKLRSPAAADRSEALAALGKVQPPDAALLSLVAESLLDDVEDVRVSAAYSLAGVAGKLGCNLEALADCKLFASVLDATPQKSKRVPPKYPDEAKRLREQGRVRMQCLVKADGTVSMIQVLSGPPILREAAVESLRRSQYEPAKKSGKPVPFAMLYHVNFVLN